MDLIDIIDALKEEAEAHNRNGEETLSLDIINQVESLVGILHLIDAIQDYAADVMGIPEDELFNLKN